MSSLKCIKCKTPFYAFNKQLNLPSSYWDELLDCYYCHAPSEIHIIKSNFTPKYSQLLVSNTHSIALNCTDYCSGCFCFISKDNRIRNDVFTGCFMDIVIHSIHDLVLSHASYRFVISSPTQVKILLWVLNPNIQLEYCSNLSSNLKFQSISDLISLFGVGNQNKNGLRVAYKKSNEVSEGWFGNNVERLDYTDQECVEIITACKIGSLFTGNQMIKDFNISFLPISFV